MEIDLTKWKIHSNQTAHPDSAVFTILPDYLAAELSKPDVRFEFGALSLHFRRCPLAPGGKGAELVSWPPLFMSENGDQWAWSVVLTITAQTVPFQSFPVVYCDLGVRRWVSEPISYISGRKDTSVGLLTEKPLIQGLHHSDSFQVAPMTWDKTTKTYTWSNNLVPLLNLLQIDQFPVAQDLTTSPLAAMNLGGTRHAAIFYRHGISPGHPVGSGFWPGDRHPFTRQLADKLKPVLMFTEAPAQKKYRIEKRSNPFSEKTKKENTVENQRFNEGLYRRRRQLVERAVGHHITIEIWYQTSTICHALLQAICQFFGFSMPENPEQNLTFSSSEITITIKMKKLGEIGDILTIDSNIKKEKDRVGRAVYQRIQDITAQIPVTEEKTGVTYDPAPTAPAWNPGLFELTVACIQSEDEAWIWAALTHELRNTALNYDEATALPWADEKPVQAASAN